MRTKINPKKNKMKTLTSFFNGKTENATFNRFEDSALSFNAMTKVLGGDGIPEIWIPDDDDTK